eukprot:1160690-Pelagomonas_calceolata.AAC.10
MFKVKRTDLYKKKAGSMHVDKCFIRACSQRRVEGMHVDKCFIRVCSQRKNSKGRKHSKGRMHSGRCGGIQKGKEANSRNKPIAWLESSLAYRSRLSEHSNCPGTQLDNKGSAAMLASALHC